MPVFIAASYFAFKGVQLELSGDEQRTLGPMLRIGGYLGGIASSMYLKDNNPELLDKEPFWKKTYEWFKNRLSVPSTNHTF